MRNILLLVSWICLCLAALTYFALQQLRHFDPDNSLHISAMSTEFERQVEAHFKAKLGNVESTGIHIQAENCRCNFANNRHVDRLDKQLNQLSFRSVKLTTEQADLPTQILPSAPAILIFNSEGKLSYFGPYSSGYFCNSANSLVDKLLARIATNLQQTPFIVSDSEGCYCNNTA